MSGNQGRQLNRRRGSSTDKSGQEDRPDLSRPNISDELLDFMKGIAIKQPVPEELNVKSPLRQNVKRAKPKVNTNIRSHKSKPMRVKASLIVHDSHEHTGATSPTSDSEHSDSSESQSDDTGRKYHELFHPKPTTKISEYEIAILWTQFRENFPSGQVNRIQLGQMLRQVFPKCDQAPLDTVVNTVMSIFDPIGVGTISFRELLITFALSMEAPLIEKLNWTYRLYDEEGQGEIYLDDLVQIVWKLCELTKSAEILLKDGPPKMIEGNGEENEEEDVETLVKAKTTPRDHNSSTPPATPRKPKNIRLLSNKLGHRVESAREKRRERPSSTKTERAKTNKRTKVCKTNSNEIKLDEVEKALAKKVVAHLDKNGDGRITREEFIEGCLSDNDFLCLLQCFNGEIIWGNLFQVTSISASMFLDTQQPT